MGDQHRRCDARCHDAQGRSCSCWCGGIFHGAQGEAARAAFVATYGRPIPPQSPELMEPLLHWHQVGSTFSQGMRAALEARAALEGELDQVDAETAA